MSAKRTEASIASWAPWVVRVWRAATSVIFCRSDQYRIATGASLVRAPLPAARGSVEGIARPLEETQCGRHGVADVEAGTSAGVGSVLPPIDEACHQIMRVEIGMRDEALRQRESH